jgi:hypothetical protein
MLIVKGEEKDIKLWPFKLIEGLANKSMIVVNIRVKRSILLQKKSHLWLLKKCVRLRRITLAQL